MSEAAPTISSEVVEIVTIGLPFCVFKGLVGGLLLRQGAVVSGALLAALCVADVVFNLANLGALLLLRRRALSSCTLSAILVRSRLFARSPNEYVKDLGNSLDVLLSFSLVAWMVGLGRVVALPLDHLRVWNIAVVLNVLGAGLSRVGASFRAMPVKR